MRRILHLWLHRWPIDRLRRRAAESPRRPQSAAPAEAAALATVADAAGRRVLVAVDPAAAAAGLSPGMPLADALCLMPGLATVAATPAEDAAALRRLAEWCGRYSPWTAPDGTDGVKLEITGCAHLWGGEAALAADLASRLDRNGIAHRIAVADTPGAAWAFARFAEPGQSIVIQPSEKTRAGLAALPVEALRLDPVTARGLRRVGLKRVGELAAMPRAALARRFGETVGRRLDQAQGDLTEPLSPLSETPARRVRLSFAEPIADPADLALAAERLTSDLVARLAREGTGARRLDLAFHRIDSRVEHISLGTARPSRDPRHLAALFKERLDTIDPGLGVEDMILAAFAVEPLPPEQLDLAGTPAGTSAEKADKEAGGVAALLDRLGNRLGFAAISRLAARESHIPERASVRAPVGGEENKARILPPLSPLAGGEGSPRTDGPAGRSGGKGAAPIDGVNPPHPPGANALGPSLPSLESGEGLFWKGWQKPPRPVRLFDPPEPVEAFWLLPDDPPFRFTWRRRAYRVVRADGPERIAAEWWRVEQTDAAPCATDTVRDYYRVEDEQGRRFWLFRAGLPGGDPAPRWYAHGVFA